MNSYTCYVGMNLFVSFIICSVYMICYKQKKNEYKYMWLGKLNKFLLI